MNYDMRGASVAAATLPTSRLGLYCIGWMMLLALLVGCGQKGPLTLPPAAASSPAATQ
jgi:Prokaryotic lipoprotein-attachment site